MESDGIGVAWTALQQLPTGVSKAAVEANLFGAEAGAGETAVRWNMSL